MLIRMYTHTCVFMHVGRYPREATVCMYVFMYVCMYIRMYVFVCVCGR